MKKRFRKKRSSANPAIRMFIIILSMTVATAFIITGIIANQRVPVRTSDSNNQTRMQAILSPFYAKSILASVIPAFYMNQQQLLQVNLSGSVAFLNQCVAELTDVNPKSLWSLLSTQIPVLHPNGYLLHAVNPDDANKYTNPPSDTNSATPKPNTNQNVPPSATDPNAHTPGGASESKPVIYIYHTHNRESFLPNLPKDLQADQAYDPNINITLVGKQLMEDLDTRGITTIQTTNDYWKYGDYPYSRKTVQKELEKYPSLSMIFDIHRDSGPRDKTTTVINGQTVGRIFFIIGGANPNYQENLKLADKLNKKMEAMYPGNGTDQPGLSEGIWVKQKNPDYDTTYNQDLNPNSVLIEVGGPYNSLDEEKRSADLLANVIQAVYQDEHKQTPKGS